MCAMSCALVTEAIAPLATLLPSRSTVKTSAISRTSSRKWLM